MAKQRRRKRRKARGNSRGEREKEKIGRERMRKMIPERERKGPAEPGFEVRVKCDYRSIEL